MMLWRNGHRFRDRFAVVNKSRGYHMNVAKVSAQIAPMESLGRVKRLACTTEFPSLPGIVSIHDQTFLPIFRYDST